MDNKNTGTGQENTFTDLHSTELPNIVVISRVNNA